MLRDVMAELRAGSDDFLMMILSSPSGAGKTTLCSKLRKEFPALAFSVSHTTRKPRTGELDSREYHFVEEPDFRKLVEEDAFAEWAEVHGNLYGTSLAEIERARQAGSLGILFDIDFQGARQIRARVPEVISVFILPPSMAELERRLRSRASEDEPTVQRRLAKAKLEISNYSMFDYLVVNDDLEKAFERMKSILVAESARRMRKSALAESLLRRGRL